MSFWYISSILPKIERKNSTLFSFVFWENWRHRKHLEITDLYAAHFQWILIIYNFESTMYKYERKIIKKHALSLQSSLIWGYFSTGYRTQEVLLFPSINLRYDSWKYNYIYLPTCWVSLKADNPVPPVFGRSVNPISTGIMPTPLLRASSDFQTLAHPWPFKTQ